MKLKVPICAQLVYYLLLVVRKGFCLLFILLISFYSQNLNEFVGRESQNGGYVWIYIHKEGVRKLPHLVGIMLPRFLFINLSTF